MNRSGIPRPSRLPLIVAVLVIPIVAATALGGAGLAVFVAAIILVVILIVAVRARPREPIEVAREHGGPRRVLLAISQPVDDPRTAEAVARAVRVDSAIVDTEILALAPTQPSFLDRWASDVRAARSEAQRKLAVTVASLPDGKVNARSEIGESDLVVAVEDALHRFAANEVILVTGQPERDRAGARAASELRDRLPVPFEHLLVGSNGESRLRDAGFG